MEDFEKYKLVVGTHTEGNLQLISDPNTGVSTWQTWKRRRNLGQGAFGEVWQEAWEDQHGDVHYRAVKRCSEKRMREACVDYKRELSALAAFSRSECASWFVNLYGWWMESGNLCVAMEYLGRGDLSRYIADGLLEMEIKEIAENVLQGLAAMHQSGFTHRDIKPQNILVFKKRPEFHRWWVKIADFGISKQIVADSESILQTTVGTRPYCAPEVLGYSDLHQKTSAYNNKVDMWSFGCVLFNLGSKGQLPFSDIELTRYCDGRIEFNPKDLTISMSNSGISLIKAFLQVDPRQRPTATEALHHLWLSKETSTTLDMDRQPPQKPHSNHQQNFNSFLNSTVVTRPSANTTIKKPPLPPRDIASTGDKAVHTLIELGLPKIAQGQTHGALMNSTLPQILPDDFKAVAGRLVSSTAQQPTDSESKLRDDFHDRLKFASAADQGTDVTVGDEESKSRSAISDLRDWRERNRGVIESQLYNHGGTEMHVAASRGQPEILELLIQDSKSVHTMDGRARTPLHWATMNGHLETANWLVDHGADLEAVNPDGVTALQTAAMYGHLEIVKMLAIKGADVNMRNGEGKTAMHSAAAGGYLEILKWLVRQRANLDAKDDYGWTPLHRAAIRGRTEVVKWLLMQGADIEATDVYGWTALHRAASNGHAETVRCLVKQGANTHATTAAGRTPWSYAKDDKVAKWLDNDGSAALETD